MYKTLQITIQPLVLLLNLFLSDNTKGRQFILAINMDIKKKRQQTSKHLIEI